MVQTSPRILASPRLPLAGGVLVDTVQGTDKRRRRSFLRLAVWVQAEGVAELCADGSFRAASAGQHAHWWDEGAGGGGRRKWTSGTGGEKYEGKEEGGREEELGGLGRRGEDGSEEARQVTGGAGGWTSREGSTWSGATGWDCTCSW
eukprot:768397-Hanusia_phi.AAC.10